MVVHVQQNSRLAVSIEPIFFDFELVGPDRQPGQKVLSLFIGGRHVPDVALGLEHLDCRPRHCGSRAVSDSPGYLGDVYLLRPNQRT